MIRAKSFRTGTKTIIDLSPDLAMRDKDDSANEYAIDRDFVDSGHNALRGRMVETVSPPLHNTKGGGMSGRLYLGVRGTATAE